METKAMDIRLVVFILGSIVLNHGRSRLVLDYGLSVACSGMLKLNRNDRVYAQ